MEERTIKNIVSETIMQLLEADMLEFDDRWRNEAVKRKIEQYFEGKATQQEKKIIDEFFNKYEDDEYIEIIIRHYKNRQKMEIIAAELNYAVSTVYKHKRRLQIELYKMFKENKVI